MILVGCKAKPQPSFENDYPSMLAEDHVFEKVNYTTALNLLLDNTGVLLIGYNENNPMNYTHTKTVIPILNQAAKETGYEKVYYLDLYDMKEKLTTEYRLLLAYLEYTVGDLQVVNDEKTIVTPDVYFVYEGKIIGHHIGTLKNDNGSFYKSLDEDQENTLKIIYRDLFTELKANINK